MNCNPVYDMMAQGVADGVFPGGVLLCARGSDIFFFEAFGLADLAQKRQMKKDAVFDLASLTKPLATSAAMMVLVQEGRLGLHTCLAEVLPGAVAPDKAKITMEMLLRHTSGLPAHRAFHPIIADLADPGQALIDAVLAEPLENSPGSRQVYSDLGFMLLCHVIETVTQQGLDQFVRDRVYTPLGIRDLFFIHLGTKDVPKDRDRLVSTRNCPWRGRVLTGEVEDENAWAAGGAQGHAGLFGDALSIHTLCLEIMQAIEQQPTRVLDPATAAAFVKKYPGQTLVAGFDTPSRTGSSAGRFFSSRTVGHLGFTGTSFWMDPDSGLVVVLLTNRVHPSRSNQKIKKFRPAVHDCIAGCLR
ncbi:MAG: beta-lactamase family protein [Desulfotignum sp.]|nr:beta-lactamase family protein [Desulfotignum sp.]MCF8113428.1 beta-lactamase family protein [Desulfotignum sp.]MCF8125304.1 beta-lactamase family protein [Desulfotignum sp.]